ncbi:hypothetical protein LP419_10075 [Massilia sp. H-1]|nr:hypothetical protein LP419_10075 [Massilia sp. H-1]
MICKPRSSSRRRAAIARTSCSKCARRWAPFSIWACAKAARADAALATLRGQLADAALRLEELRDYALDADAAQALGRTLAQGAGKLEIGPMLDQDVLMGWAISVDRAAR